ncbi:AMSH-like ubiquitin thioesterase 2 [Selaginella moellendorffii]|uniref:AMSH-like ubiquitin thioesterase 2 n=1 Tax=Selaginella moellendorffii TaxID=88036 RepID=UPI000D1D08E6|nr:AMSH-like ubiquitin thioesterase 2 [Selaginella moellendorffii]|eukprot:XP_002989585.2 AMSH-like ubiquitin thioesterase 2 [Selaginella moellendorffii]
MNIAESAPKLEVNQRLPLRHYYRIADNLLRQARIYRSEKNVLELYILLLRFTSLVIDTIPAHNEYKRFSDSQKALLRQRVLEALAELESLKPLVKKALEAPFPVKRNASLEYNKYDPNPAKNRWQTSPQTNWQNTWQGTARPRDETLSRHSYFTLPSRKPMEQPIKVTYPSYIDVSHIEIPSFDQNSFSVSSSEPTALPPQYSLVNQLAPPPVPVPVQNVQCLPPTTVADPRPGSPKVSNEKGPKHLYVSPTMMEEFLALARHNTQKNLETCGVLAGFLEKGMFSVTTLIIPKQEATSDSCQTVNEEELFEVQDKRNLFQLGWIHTHPTQTCFMSSIDLHTHYSYQVMLQEAIAIVMAPTDEERSFGIFRLSEPGGMEAIQQCDQRGFHPHDEPANGGSIYDHCSHVYMNPSLRFDIVDLRI